VSADASGETTQALIADQFAARSLSMSQAREALGVSRRTLYYWIKRGRLQTVRTSMGSQRVLLASVKEHWLVRNWARADRERDGLCTETCGQGPRRLI